jgi:hypothetical protein
MRIKGAKFSILGFFNNPKLTGRTTYPPAADGSGCWPPFDGC